MKLWPTFVLGLVYVSNMLSLCFISLFFKTPQIDILQKSTLLLLKWPLYYYLAPKLISSFERNSKTAFIYGNMINHYFQSDAFKMHTTLKSLKNKNVFKFGNKDGTHHDDRKIPNTTLINKAHELSLWSLKIYTYSRYNLYTNIFVVR